MFKDGDGDKDSPKPFHPTPAPAMALEGRGSMSEAGHPLKVSPEHKKARPDEGQRWAEGGGWAKTRGLWGGGEEAVLTAPICCPVSLVSLRRTLPACPAAPPPLRKGKWSQLSWKQGGRH